MAGDLGGEGRIDRGRTIQGAALERDPDVADGLVQLLITLRDIHQVDLGDLRDGDERGAGDMAIEGREEHAPLLLTQVGRAEDGVLQTMAEFIVGRDTVGRIVEMDADFRQELGPGLIGREFGEHDLARDFAEALLKRGRDALADGAAGHDRFEDADDLVDAGAAGGREMITELVVGGQHDRTADLGAEVRKSAAELIAAGSLEGLLIELGLEDQLVAEGRDRVTTVQGVEVGLVAPVDLRLADEEVTAVPLEAKEVDAVLGVLEVLHEVVPAFDDLVADLLVRSGAEEERVLDQVIGGQVLAAGVEGLEELDRVILVVGADGHEDELSREDFEDALQGERRGVIEALGVGDELVELHAEVEVSLEDLALHEGAAGGGETIGFALEFLVDAEGGHDLGVDGLVAIIRTSRSVLLQLKAVGLGLVAEDGDALGVQGGQFRVMGHLLEHPREQHGQGRQALLAVEDHAAAVALTTEHHRPHEVIAQLGAVAGGIHDVLPGELFEKVLEEFVHVILVPGVVALEPGHVEVAAFGQDLLEVIVVRMDAHGVSGRTMPERTGSATPSSVIYKV